MLVLLTIIPNEDIQKQMEDTLTCFEFHLSIGLGGMNHFVKQKS
ncbi:hypothetical protein P4534_06375 [Peribacillus butanolivorans]|nr:hypothetical protein [Peribacillus butanolivorans]